jgi:stage II sporulation protein D
MRVLVDKDAAFGELRAPEGALYFRDDAGGAWQKRGERSRVASRRGRLEVDGVVTDTSGAYFRGGASTRAPIEVGKQRYPGALRLTARDESLLLTNIVPLELYLAGTVGSEMPPSWPLEALKAQAVASRSYALYMHAHPRDPLYDLERTVLDQVYGGAKKGLGRVEEALAATRDEVLVYDRAIVKAYYHSQCGGSTDAPAAVWGRAERGPYGSVRCASCERTPSRWSTFVSWEELKRKLEVPFATEWLEKRWPSGRVASLRLPKSRLEWSGETLRKVLGYGRLKSTRFRWSASAAGVFVDGVGFGHGVGMCQWGARAMALAGRDYRSILAHYYPGARLVRASEVLDSPGSAPRRRVARASP